jgi:hypothetical protein
MLLRNVARVALLGATLIAAAASASSKQQAPVPTGPAAPASQPMDPSQALGLWKTSFGAVKIETNDAGGPGAIHGVWVYTNQGGQEVIGYFGGTLSGNVLQFTWQEPGDNGAPLVGAGYLVFDAYGQKFDGQWWTNTRDRTGEWSGTRAAAATAPAYGGAQYGGSVYGQY